MRTFSEFINFLRLNCALLIFAVPLVAADAQPPNATRESEFFETKVRPLLLEKCVSCHGDAKQKGALRLDSRQALLKGGDNGPVLVPGEPQKSALIRVVHYNGEIKMPPAGKLKPDEIAALEQWVKNGAVWPESAKPPANSAAPDSTPFITEERRNFWSFQPVKRPVVPVVKNKAWIQAPIDNFILSELEKRGLTPAAPADKATLLRRATFDLTGLPPTPEEVRAFIADNRRDAYAKLIDRLLDSPSYGEHWGRHWLDVARYADSHDSRGSGSDGDISEAWRYRDWVVDAFNRDLPYDQFIVQQVAGDILATRGEKFDASGVIATGLLAIGNWGNGDADKEKVQTDIADDQVDIVTRGFLGLTVACARCHDHKFDPISTRDYYALSGMFFSTHILPKMAEKGAGESMLRIPLALPQDIEKGKQSAAKISEAEAKLKAETQEHYVAYAKEMQSQAARYLMAVYDYRNGAKPINSGLEAFAAQRDLHPHALRQWMSYSGVGDYRLMATPVRDVLGSAGVHGFKVNEDTPSMLVNTNAEARKLLTFTLPPQSVSIHPSPADGVVVTWKSPIDGTIKIKGSVADADGGGGDGIAWAIELRSRGAKEIASGDVPNGGAQKFPDAPLAALSVVKGDLIELLVLPKASHGYDTTIVDLTIETEDGKSVWNLAADVVGDLHQNGKGNPHSDKLGNADVWRFGDMTGSLRGKKAPDDSPLAQWQNALAGTREAAEMAANAFQKSFILTDKSSPFWINNREDETALAPATRESLEKQRIALDSLRKDAPPPLQFANGAQEGGVPQTPYAGFHDVRVHKRGSYARLGDVVPRAFPVVLAGEKQAPITQGSGRLELARWLANDKNPLTARVMVNRIWQGHFGAGIVRTPSNFGFLGERPTHPRLLDYLASEFAQGGWSLKKLHRAIMLSATYQQSSQISRKMKQADADNHLFGRMNRRRLQSEAIRDSLLSVAGRLKPERSGISIRDFKTPRRTLYITTIRSDRAGYGPLFDAADSTASVDRRTVSTVAPQALFLMNDPFILEQSQALAKRLAAVADEKSRINEAYQLLFGRAPSEGEIAIGLKFLAARESNVWEQYCQILLYSNEFVYVD